MRILPLAFWLQSEPSIEKRWQTVKDVSSITHGHFRSCFACFIYVEFAIDLLNWKLPLEALKDAQERVAEFAKNQEFNPTEVELFKRVLIGNPGELERNTLSGSGYVLHSLESSLWAFLSSDTYEETVFKAINLGDDTDTTGAIAGGLAGIYFPWTDKIKNWKKELAKHQEIDDLILQFYKRLP